MLDRTLPPSFVKSTSFHLPQVSRIKLSNGVKLLHLNNIQQELVKIEIIFNAGKWFEPRPEVAHFTVQMLDKGTKSMSSMQIAELFDHYGAHIELSSTLDFTSVSLYSLSKHLAAVYPIFFELITAPSFNKAELDQLKDHYIQSLRVKKEKTSYLASNLIRKKLFGSTHPYGQSAEESDIYKIEAEDLDTYFQERMKPAYLFVLGQITTDDLDVLQSSITSIGANSIPPTPSPIINYNNTPELIEKENSVQSSIRLGKRTIQRVHKDYPGLLILNYYLGGYFGSKLMKNLREDKGLTYGISSSINSFKNDSIMLIGTDVNKENKSVASDEIMKEIRLLQSSINEEELELAKRHFIGSLQGEIASPFSILGKIKNIELHQLPVSYYQNLITQIDSISIDALHHIANIYYQEESFVEISVG